MSNEMKDNQQEQNNMKTDKKLYFIENQGCDDETYGLARLDDKEYDFFNNIIQNLNRHSSYGCMPTIRLTLIDENKVEKVTPEEMEKQTFGYDQNPIWLDGEPYKPAKEVGCWWNIKI